MIDYENKNILVTGSRGMIGTELVKLLKEQKAIVHHADLADNIDLRYYDTCEFMCTKIDYVFHLAGIKGNPKRTKERPADYLEPMLQFDTNMIRAAREKKVKGFLYTSSIAVENPETDRYPAWAKKTGEILLEAYRIQYPEFKSCIVRPANVYGKYDNFHNPYAMVITSLIRQAYNGKIEIYGNGSQTRDFINAYDVARGMIETMDTMPNYPVRLCSGEGVTIKKVAEIIQDIANVPIVYLSSEGQTMGDNYRVMEPNSIFKPLKTLKVGIWEAITWNKPLKK